MQSLRDGHLELELGMVLKLVLKLVLMLVLMLVLKLELVLALLDRRISAILARIVDASHCHGLWPAGVDNCRSV